MDGGFTRSFAQPHTQTTTSFAPIVRNISLWSVGRRGEVLSPQAPHHSPRLRILHCIVFCNLVNEHSLGRSFPCFDVVNPYQRWFNNGLDTRGNGFRSISTVLRLVGGGVQKLGPIAFLHQKLSKLRPGFAFLLSPRTFFKRLWSKELMRLALPPCSCIFEEYRESRQSHTSSMESFASCFLLLSMAAPFQDFPYPSFPLNSVEQQPPTQHTPTFFLDKADSGVHSTPISPPMDLFATPLSTQRTLTLIFSTMPPNTGRGRIISR